MRARRIPVAVLMGAVAPLAAAITVVVPVGPAAAHGAPENPLSRTAACAPGGPYVESAACQAALAASGRAAFDDWDYVRVAGVAGRDREVIPDGGLCSGGNDGFAGLDLPRADWPVTELVAGADLTFTYLTTIPHQGTFRMYVTADGFDPEQPLAWADLDEEPFLTAADPEVVDGAYRMPGRLPGGKTGRHILFTIWQNSDTPDTYYSCADVVFGSPATAPASPPATAVASDGGGADRAGSAGLDRAPRPAASSATVALAAGGAAVVLAVAGAVVINRVRRRGRRRLRG